MTVTQVSGGSEISGTVRIAPEVLATIVTLAALAVPGVEAMGTVPGHGLFPRSRHDTTHGVRLAVRQNTVSIEIYIVVAPAMNMVSTGAAVQRTVSAAIHDMVGMDVKDVDVYIQKIE